MLVDIVELLDVLISGHAAAHPELWQLKQEVERLTYHLVPHMLNEEKYLFPYMATMERPVGPDRTVLVPRFGTVQYPLQAIQHDHSEDLEFLKTMRKITRDFTTPANACDHHKVLYTMLAEFAHELEEHIRLENDVLFPRAIEIERSAFRKGATSPSPQGS
jgi:regulator of cell morphogenesis and NO signaling